jgi:hypothetical protein
VAHAPSLHLVVSKTKRESEKLKITIEIPHSLTLEPVIKTKIQTK